MKNIENESNKEDAGLNIILDDQIFDTEANRILREGEIGVRNFEEFKAVIEKAKREGAKISSISFDNDLGEGETEGFKILEWLKDTYPEIIIEADCKAHSANLSRKKTMNDLIADIKHRPQEYIDAKDRPSPWGEVERKK